MVEPAAAKAAELTRNGKIGLIATRASVASGAYESALRNMNPALSIQALACPLFVPLVEEGRCRPGDVVIETVAKEYLDPLLLDVIGGIMGPDVRLIDVGAEAARQCRDLLAAKDALAGGPGGVSCYTSDRAANFQRLASLFLGEDLSGKVEQVDIAQY